MDESREELNYFLVKAFQEILRIEESAICRGDLEELSVREVHILESVCDAVERGTDNRASAIAALQRITPGTLTTAVRVLEKKGYLTRRQDDADRRIVRIFPTEKGRQADAVHRQFHRELVEHVMQLLSREEVDVMIKGLDAVRRFFENKYENAGRK